MGIGGASDGTHRWRGGEGQLAKDDEHGETPETPKGHPAKAPIRPLLLAAARGLKGGSLDPRGPVGRGAHPFPTSHRSGRNIFAHGVLAHVPRQAYVPRSAALQGSWEGALRPPSYAGMCNPCQKRSRCVPSLADGLGIPASPSAPVRGNTKRSSDVRSCLLAYWASLSASEATAVPRPASGEHVQCLLPSNFSREKFPKIRRWVARPNEDRYNVTTTTYPTGWNLCWDVPRGSMQARP